MLELYQFPPIWSLSSGSTFCTKVEAYLRIKGIPYTNVYQMDPRKAPRKQMPYLIDTGKHHTISDSECIFDYLDEISPDTGSPLDSKEKGEALAWVRCFDHHYHWCLTYTRWMMPENWEITKPIYFATIPKILRNTIANSVKKGVIKTLYEHGLGRHDEKSILARGVQDINALAAYLGNRSTLIGNRVTRYDMSIYAMLVHTIRPPIESPLKDAVLSHDNLCQYVQLMDDLLRE